MKKLTLVFGLISGLIVSVLMIYTTAMCYRNADFESSMLLGYASMILAFSLIFIGVKSYRDKHNKGHISFGKAFKIGLYITLVSSTLYVLVWLVDYYVFIPDFMERYTAHVLNETIADGATQAEIESKTAEMTSYAEMYKNPFFVVLFTYAEILPVGFLISLLSALILKRRSGSHELAVPA